MPQGLAQSSWPCYNLLQDWIQTSLWRKGALFLQFSWCQFPLHNLKSFLGPLCNFLITRKGYISSSPPTPCTNSFPGLFSSSILVSLPENSVLVPSDIIVFLWPYTRSPYLLSFCPYLWGNWDSSLISFHSLCVPVTWYVKSWPLPFRCELPSLNISMW